MIYSFVETVIDSFRFVDYESLICSCLCCSSESVSLIFVGWGADEKAIISILAHRNAIQRRHIRIAYEQLFQEDLVKRLESEISGHFEVLFLFFFEIVVIILVFFDFIRYDLPLQLLQFPAHCCLSFSKIDHRHYFPSTIVFICSSSSIVTIIFTIHV